MLNFEQLVLEVTTPNPAGTIPTATSGATPYNSPNSSTSNSYGTGTQPASTSTVTTGFDINKSFNNQVLSLISQLYPSSNPSEILKTYFYDLAVKLQQTSGYGAMTNTELNRYKNYWPIMDLGVFILSELGYGSAGKGRFTELKQDDNKTLSSLAINQYTKDEIKNAFDTFAALIEKNKNPRDFKAYKNYRIAELANNTYKSQIIKGLAKGVGDIFTHMIKH